MLKVGLIGCGYMGSMHAEAWMRMTDKVRLVAVADRNTERVTELVSPVGAHVYADAEEMLRCEVLDVVDICTPTSLHAPMILKAMDHVRDIVVEKPLCLTAEETDLLLEAQMKKGTRVQVAHVARFNPEYEYLAETVQDGRYGKLLSAQFSRLSPPPLWMHGFDDESFTGGMALDFHIHDVDFVRYLMGNADPDALYSHGTVHTDGVIRHLWSAYHYGDTRLFTEASWYYPLRTRGFCAKLEKATLILEHEVLTVYPNDGDAFVPALRKISDAPTPTFTDKIHYELSCFADAILRDAPAVVSLRDAAGAIRLAKREIAQIKENVK